MKTHHLNLLIPLGLWLIALNGCNRANTTTAIPTSLSNEVEFVQEITTNTNPEGNLELCLQIDQFPFWEAGVMYPEPLTNQLGASLTLAIDEILMDEDDFYTLASLGFRNVYNENDEVIGRYGTELITCINTAQLTTGHHEGKISFTTLSGRVLESTWKFEIIENGSSKYIVIEE